MRNKMLVSLFNHSCKAPAKPIDKYTTVCFPLSLEGKRVKM